MKYTIKNIVGAALILFSVIGITFGIIGMYTPLFPIKELSCFFVSVGFALFLIGISIVTSERDSKYER